MARGATIPLGRYLWERIHQTGVCRIFGVPGDFNLQLLDHIYDVNGLEWVGNTNELNAAYAADGYARVSQGAGCVVTTHGVGELSALNAIAGSMTEQVKVIHVVGQTPRKFQLERKMIHHSIGSNPDHQIFNRASREFRVAAAELKSEKGATEEIDRVLRECFVKSGPVYIFFPIDLHDKLVSADALKKPLDLDPTFDRKLVGEAVEAVLQKLYSSKNPAIFVDCLTQRHEAGQEVRQLVDKLGIAVYASNMGKGIIDETSPNYVGVYNGICSALGVQAAFEASDLVLILGNLHCDTNSGGFTRELDPSNIIYIDPQDIDIFGKERFTAPIKVFLKTLYAKVDPTRLPKFTKPILPISPLEPDHDSNHITHSWIWNYLAQNFFQPHDVIFGETGTAAFGIPGVRFPPNINWITQVYYGSIGYATPSALGAEMALIDRSKNNTEPRGRTLLVTGDGSLMLTVQEVGNMVKHGLAPVILLINNGGYTIERVIHGAEKSYNDIVPFDYRHMLPFFSMPAEEARKSFHRCTTRVELAEVLRLETVRLPKTVQVVEIVMDRLDVPWQLSSEVATKGPETRREMTDAGVKSWTPSAPQ